MTRKKVEKIKTRINKNKKCLKRKQRDNSKKCRHKKEVNNILYIVHVL